MMDADAAAASTLLELLVLLHRPLHPEHVVEEEGVLVGGVSRFSAKFRALCSSTWCSRPTSDST